MNDAAAFMRFSRDKRGYEHFYLVQPTTNRRGKTRARILYWFRSPPGVKVGRLPFDEEMRRAIEAQNPGVVFDWKRLLATPIPPPSADVEKWRERRRLEKAERAARRAAAAAGNESEAEAEASELGEDAEVAESAELDVGVGTATGPPEVATTEAAEPPAAASQGGSGAANGRRRRRRRRGRRTTGAPGV